MKVHLVRHAAAGHRSGFDGPDVDRPLTGKGRSQARGIAATLADAGVTDLISSPYVRCVQTFDPAAEMLGLEVVTDRRLAEGAGGAAALDLAAELAADGHGGSVALCSHGDIIPEMLHLLRCEGTRFKEPLQWPKGSTWVLTGDGHVWAKARYLPPPST